LSNKSLQRELILVRNNIVRRPDQHVST